MRHILAIVLTLLPAQASAQVAYLAATSPAADATPISGACATKLGAAIASVYQRASLANVQSWQCVRDGGAVMCSGEYADTVDAAVWRAAEQAKSYRATLVTAVNGSNVTFTAHTTPRELDQAQTTALQTFAASCAPAGVVDLMYLGCRRSVEPSGVLCRFVYRATAATDAELADKARQGMVAGFEQ